MPISYRLNLGQFPFLVHEERSIPTFALIAKYVAKLEGVNLDVSLNHTEKSQKVAWCAHIESHLGDLVVSPHISSHSGSLTLEVSYPVLPSRKFYRSDSASVGVYVTCTSALLCSRANT